MEPKQKTRRTRFTIETDEVLIVRKPKKTLQFWCAGCRERVPMIPSEQAAQLAGVSLGTIWRHIEIHKVHFVETANGQGFICLTSLLESKGN